MRYLQYANSGNTLKSASAQRYKQQKSHMALIIAHERPEENLFNPCIFGDIITEKKKNTILYQSVIY